MLAEAKFRFPAVFYWVLGLGLIIAILVFNWVENEQEVNARIRFEDISQQVAISFEREIIRSNNALNSIVAFFSSSNRVSRIQFQTFVSMNEADRTGVQALEWIPRVSDSDRAAFEGAARADGLEQFAFRQIGDDGMELASNRAEYFPVFYVEPLAGNEKALGFDLASNPIRKAALEQARDNGTIVASSRIKLVQENATQSGVVVFAPIYRGNKQPETVEERRRALAGFALGVFRIGDLLTSAITESAHASDLLISLYDVLDLKNGRPLHLFGIENNETWPEIAVFKRGPYFEHLYDFGSRQWQLVITPRTGTLSVELPWLPWFTALVIVIIALLIGLYLHFMLQRKEYAEDLVRIRTKELEVINEELDAFAHSVSHDLRAPLRGLDGFSQALMEDHAEKLDGEALNYLNRISKASRRMGQMIDDILTLSRATRQELQMQHVNLSDYAQAILGDLRKRDPDRSVTIKIAPNVTARGDPSLLRVVLDNLLGNAWKFTSRKEIAKIEFGVHSKDREPVYFVRDDGAGFDMAYEDKLFGIFQRLHTATEFEGTGIGLATVARLVRRHGGRVWAEGEVNKGASFYFTLED